MGLGHSYIEASHAIAEANRIFGFDGWNRETITTDCVWQGGSNGNIACSYTAQVRVSVRAGDSIIRRESCGSGKGEGLTPGEAHEKALNDAETDAMQWALSTFGNPFGLGLNSRGPMSDQKPRVEQAGKPVVSRAKAATSAKPLPPFGKRIRNKDHLRFVASQNCLVCGRCPSHAHHIKFAQPRAMGRKVSDEWAVPLCYIHHRALHDRGDEKAWWEKNKIEPIQEANRLWSESQNVARKG